MIRRVSGSVVLRDEVSVVLDVGGIGYRIFVPSHTLFELERVHDASLWTYHAVRENVADLYGFKTLEELSFFELLLSVSGIGPKSALAILSIASLGELKRAIRENNPAYLTKVSGVGRKNAEKIVLELKDKLGGVAEEGAAATSEGDIEVLEALEALGYPMHIARNVLRTIPKDIEETPERIKHALKQLGS